MNIQPFIPWLILDHISYVTWFWYIHISESCNIWNRVPFIIIQYNSIAIYPKITVFVSLYIYIIVFTQCQICLILSREISKYSNDTAANWFETLKYLRNGMLCSSYRVHRIGVNFIQASELQNHMQIKTITFGMGRDFNIFITRNVISMLLLFPRYWKPL